MIAPPGGASVDHGGSHDLRGEEGALQVGVDDPVPQRLGHIQRGADLFHAGIVHQHVHGAKAADGAPDRVHIGLVAGQRFDLAAQGANALGGFGKRLVAPRRDHQFGPRPRKAKGKRLPDAAAGAGDKDAAPLIRKQAFQPG